MDKRNAKDLWTDELGEAFTNKQDIPSDVLGSYTGITADWDDPVQDADDL
ncbi:MAG: hypothetical protein Q4B99_03625 [Clostridia bacterium]|nr:hypothetical protein [Clostridia bacterium]